MEPMTPVGCARPLPAASTTGMPVTADWNQPFTVPMAPFSEVMMPAMRPPRCSWSICRASA